MLLLSSSLAFAASTATTTEKGKAPPAAPAPAPAPAPVEPPAPGTFGAEVWGNLDRTADPCTDFYQYACGGWIAKTTLPPDRADYTRGFSDIDDRNQETLKQALEAAAASSDPADQKLGAFWKSCTDEAGIDAKGFAPLAPYLARIDKALKKDNKKGRAALMTVVGELQRDGFGPLFQVYVDGDAKDPSTVILQFYQGGTGLPERDYYLEARYAAIRDQYQQHVQKMFELAGWSDDEAKEAADQVVTFETELAKAEWTPEQLRDATLTYNKLDRAGLEKITTGLDWGAYFTARGRPALTKINVTAPTYFEGMAKAIAATPMPALRTYLKWRVLSASAQELAKPVADEDFRFYGQVLFGQKEQRPRWKRCVDYADAELGDLLAAKYVATAFPGESKPIAVDMIQRIEGSFEAGLPALKWMDDTTRSRAVEKARAVTNKIGYPAKWRTYGFEVKPDDFFGNVRRADAAAGLYDLDKAEKPVDPDNWLMTAPTVNAYYNPSVNEIVFPAGILQPPFFSAAYPKAYNFGAMGMVMGHELTHGFDDEGRKYDGKGMLTDWWAADAVQKFEEAAACVTKQYDGYQVLAAAGDQPAVNVKGELTLGENIADLGGTRVAFRAYQKWASENPPEDAVAGLTPDQLFFVGLAQGWCTVSSPQSDRVAAETDPHSPPRFRVNGPLSNLSEFSTAFQCAEGTPMRPANQCEVW